MNHNLGIILLLVGILVSGLAVARPQGSRMPLEARVQEFEEEQRGQLATMRLQLQAISERLDQTVKFLHSQARSAAALERALAESKKKGFTYGINPNSRIVMLGGFNRYLASIQRNLPELKQANPLANRRPVR